MEMGVKLEKMLFGMGAPHRSSSPSQLPAQLRRSRHQGHRRDRRRFRLRIYVTGNGIKTGSPVLCR
jgi:hypothetical protein